MKRFFVLTVAVIGLSACSSSPETKDVKTSDATTASKDKKEEKQETKTEAKTAMGSKSSCTLDKDTRVIEVKKTDAGGCELFYTKFGEAKSVASSGFGTQYCEEVKDRIQTNLNKAGFSCQ